MSIKEFDKLFGITSSVEEEKGKFVNRIENIIFDHFINAYEYDQYKILFIDVCYQLGLNSRDIIAECSGLSEHIPSFTKLTENDFLKSLRVLTAIYTCLDNGPVSKKSISLTITNILNKSTINIGVSWKDGLFYPTGEPLLDKELIEFSFDVLTDYPNEKKDLKTALENYTSKSSYGVVENCYLAIEGLSRRILDNKKTLIDNKPSLLQLLQFSSYWNKIFANYLNYANEYRRHAGENRHALKPSEVEAFFYLTCLIIRALLGSKSESG